MTFKGTLFLDCDGVLANFDKLANQIFGMESRAFEKQYGAESFWRLLQEHGTFFEKLELMPDAMELYEAVKHLDPIILTGAPSQIPEAQIQKQRWVRKIFGDRQRVITCQSKFKFTYCRRGDIIVDDWPKHIKKWEEAGGVWVHHDNTASTLVSLKNLGVI